MQLKYIYLLILALIGVICLTPLMAQEESISLDTLGITPFAEDTIVTIDGVKFNIPKGYGEYNKSAFDNETIVMNNTKHIQARHEYKNGDMDTISIVVYHNENQSVNPLDELYIGDDYVKKDINGTIGYLVPENGSYVFRYIKDKNVIVLTVTNESQLSSIII